MRSPVPLLATVLALALGIAPTAAAQGSAGNPGGGGSVGSGGAGGGSAGSGTTGPTPTSAATAKANRSLDGSLNLGMRQAGHFSGAYVVDLSANRTLYSRNAGTGRLPASVEKLYTTTAALQRFGPDATLTTSLLGSGTQQGSTFTGTLYLRGGGDPTFGSSA